MSMLSDFISEQGLSAQALIAGSRTLERHGVTDRALAVARETARRNKKSYDEAEAGKPTGLGRGLSEGTMKRALDGAPLSRIIRKKIVRAVNEQLSSAKKDTVTWRELFADVPVRKGKKIDKKKRK